MAMRNAARVLPDPVGAEMRTSRPARISGHPSDWGSVGLPKRAANHSATRGSKADSTAPFYGAFAKSSAEALSIGVRALDAHRR